MNFWWVNHKQTLAGVETIFGKYIWCPRRKKNGQTNIFYETMRAVMPGDIVFSYANGAIQGFGVARTQAYSMSAAIELFGHVGEAWDLIHHGVLDIDFQKFTDPVMFHCATHAGYCTNVARTLFTDSCKWPWGTRTRKSRWQKLFAQIDKTHGVSHKSSATGVA